jgi:Mrp family chromosome partitioning ATPase
MSRKVSLGASRPATPETAGRLEVLAAGTTPRDSLEIDFGRGFADVLSTLQARADLVVVEAPPLLTASDALALARHADAAVLVARAGGVTPGSAHEVLKLLERSGTAILGVVVTEPPRRAAKRFSLRARRQVPRPA